LSGPTSQFEHQYTKQGYSFIAGVDEVGRGCLAGPVVAAAVILNPKNIPNGIDDSKRLTAQKREQLDLEIRNQATTFAIGVGQVEEIDTINILNASKLAMVRAVEKLNPLPDMLLVDGNFTIDWPKFQLPVIKGDQISVSIAAASIIAKVYRDDFMAKMDSKYPGYEFAKHKGYGSRTHRSHLQIKGRSPIHRKSFNWTPV